MEWEYFPRLRTVEGLPTAVEEELGSQVGDHDRSLVGMKHMLDLLLQSLLVVLQKRLLAIFCWLAVAIVDASEYLNYVPKLVHDSPRQHGLLSLPDRVVIASLPKYFLTEHLAKDVEEFFLRSKP